MNDFIKIVGSMIVGAAIVAMGFGTALQEGNVFGGGTSGNLTASSTTFSLTTSSQRLLATSSNRVSAQFDVYHCTGAYGVFINDGFDAAATVANSDFAVFATTTEIMSPENGNPVPKGALTGITNVGTCSVKVTEWRNR